MLFGHISLSIHINKNRYLLTPISRCFMMMLWFGFSRTRSLVKGSNAGNWKMGRTWRGKVLGGRAVRSLTQISKAAGAVGICCSISVLKNSGKNVPALFSGQCRVT